MDEPTLNRLLFKQDTINIQTARKIVDGVNRHVKGGWRVETFFYPEKIRGYEQERTVTYEYGKGRPVSEDEWISYFRYIFEKRIRGNAFLIGYGICIAIGIAIVLWYYLK